MQRWLVIVALVLGSSLLAQPNTARAQKDGALNVLQQQIDQLRAHMIKVESDNAALKAKLACQTIVGHEVYFTGCNVNIRSGTGATDGPVNGLGNLVVGYNEPYPPDTAHTGSHNIVVGIGHEYTSYAGLVAGYDNEISGPFASVTGGVRNLATGTGSSISGGLHNGARGDYSSVSGGALNQAKGWASSVIGGQFNTAEGATSSISGGDHNRVEGDSSSITGGVGNTASGSDSSVSGGTGNLASGTSSSVLGGGGQNATSPNQPIPALP